MFNLKFSGLCALIMSATTATAAVLTSTDACPTVGPPVSEAALDLIKTWEGFVPAPAPDPIGLPTVGYGHLCQTSGCSEVPFPFPLNTTTATELLLSDIVTFQNCINQDITVKLNANQYGALVSWAFNEGCAGIAPSQLIARLNAGEDPDTVAAQELPKWVLAGGQVLQGLVNRRNAEIAFFQTPTDCKGIHPCAHD